MDTVVLDGVEYLKASAAAKRFQYTSDYIGQLCRGKKIDARLIGRTWFINPVSLEAHKDGRYQNLRSNKFELSETNSREPDNVNKIKPVRVQVPSPIKSKFLADAVLATQVNANNRERSLRVSYEPDEGHLIPNINKHHTPPPHRLNVDPADAKKLTIKKGKQTPVSLVAEELPDIALSGKLPVQSIEEAFTSEPKTDAPVVTNSNKDVTEKTLENNNISDEKNESEVVNSAESTAPESTRKRTIKILTNKKQVRTSTESVKNTAAIPSDSKNVTKEQQHLEKSMPSVPSFVPTSVKQVQTVRPMSPLLSYAPLLATLSAVLVVTFLLSMSTTIIFSEAGYQSQLNVQVANLLEILSQ